MSIANKIRWVASILLVFFIVLITNLIDKDNFSKLRYSVTTIYEDRIVASDLLFDLSGWMQQKEIAAITADSTFYRRTNENANEVIAGLIERYAETKLTRDEKFIFDNLQEEYTHLKVFEEKFVQSGFVDAGELLTSIGVIDQHLHDLSKVQLKESKRQMALSNKAMDTIDFFTQIEIIFLIVMAVLIQIIILYKHKLPRD